MARIKSKDTGPEWVVRRLVFSLGYRYRLHDSRLPGRPDLVFASRRKTIFVHGCFWHRHQRCSLARLPKSRPEFWLPKLNGNRLRDQRKLAALKRLGWRALVVWECQLRDTSRLQNRIVKFLDGV
jgi:DNA mismatch endonuclease, patch repair protein